MTSKIIGVGNYIPSQTITNLYFDNHRFLDQGGEALKQDNATIADKLKEITGIEERRYASSEQDTSDLGFIAAKSAIEDSGIDPETLDYIIFAHNFGMSVLERSNPIWYPALPQGLSIFCKSKIIFA